MTALVTGSSGFLGAALCRLLVDMGEPVRGFDLTPNEDPRVASAVGDLRDPDFVRWACADIDVVFHAASVVSQELGKPRLLFDVNVTGTQNLVEAASRAGCAPFRLHQLD